MLFPVQLRAVAVCRSFIGFSAVHSSPSRILVRAKSLSAIHRGLRSSEKAQYGEHRSRPAWDSAETRNHGASDRRSPRRSPATSNRREAPRARDDFMDKFNTRAIDSAKSGTRSWRQEQKLRKKLRKKLEEKKAKEEAGDEGGGRQTRRKRFTDPDNEFGKNSLVYQLKYGNLKDVAAGLPIQEPVRPRSFRHARQERRFDPLDRDVGSTENTIRTERRFDRPDRDARSRQAPDRSQRWSNREEDSTEASTQKRGRKKEMMPMTIKYTTAASQFLYGRSVVKAALEQGRRKLYKLYIYGGENRKDNKDNTIMTRLAEKQGVPITIVPTEEQRLMDKMSMGRPHNGFVLEASPLPQLPMRSLGRLEESAVRLGFHVELDFQTKEEEAINGTDSFIRRANDVMPKPFVLLLNEIMDPGNLGGILRTASYLGIDAVGITNRGSSTLTPVALKSAAGAVEEISLFTVDDPLQFVEESRKAGWKTYASVAPPDRKLVRRHGDKFVSTDAIEAKSPLNEHPCLLILGNEGYGLPKPLRVAADYELSVPRFVQASCVDSLNVSVAAGLLCHSFVKEPLTEDKTVEVETKDEIKEVESEPEEKPAEGATAQKQSANEEVEGKKPEEVEKPEKTPSDKKSEGNIEMVF